MSSPTDRDLRRIKEKRRSRVRNLRSAIIGFLFLWMIATLGLLVFLCVRVFSLQQEINAIKESNVSVGKEEVLSTVSDYSIKEDESNLAGLDDTLKVYLTFDDGPSKNTSEILKILDDNGIKATFFVQGKTDNDSKELLKQIDEEGHTLGMHTFSHSYSRIYASVDSFSEDVTNIGNLIEEATGKRPDFYRFPGGSSNDIAGSKIADYIQYLNDNNIKYVDWNVASNDAASPALSSDAIVENVMNDVVRYKTSIVLMHDAEGKESTIEALPKLIARLREAGALLLPITDETTLIQHVTLNN